MATTNQQIIDAIRAELLARIQGASIPDYTMPDGRSIRKIPSEVLERLEPRYRALAAQEAVAATGPTKAYATFARPR